MRKEKVLISICLILVITYIAFYPSLENDFVWDDNAMVAENTKIRSLSLQNIKDIFGSFHTTSLYHPLVDLSYAIEYWFFGLTPSAYHTTNLILHMLNCLLVFWFIYLLSDKIFVALPVALFFGIHPLHVESVAWVTERKDVLYALFFLGALISYIYHTKRTGKKYYYISVFLFILSLLSKAMALTLPFVLLLCDYILNIKIKKENLKEKSLFFIISFLFIILTFYGLCLSKSLRQAPPVPFYYYISFANYGLVFYLSKLIMPVRLSCFYPYPEDISSLSLVIFLILPATTIVLTLLVIISKRYTRKITFGSLFFLITILPVIQLLPSSKSIAADRYTYIPLIGLFYIAGECFPFLYSKKVFKNFLLIILTAIIGSLSYLTFHRCQVWRDSISLWSDAQKKYPTLSMAYSNRGLAYIFKKEYDRAISDYNKAVTLSPDSATAYVNRAGAYIFKKEYDRAISDYNKAIGIDPDFAKAYNWRGRAYADKKNYDMAIADYNEALMIKPGYAAAYTNRGNIYIFKKEYDRAISDYNKAISIDPDFAKAYDGRGVAYTKKGDYEQAISDYNRAIEIAPNYTKAYINRGNVYSSKKNYGLAIANYSRAIGIDPNCAEAYNNRGNVYTYIGDWDRAISDYIHVIEIDPDYREAYNNLAVGYLSKRDYDRAWENVRKAQGLDCQIDPEFLELLRKHSGRHQ